ncbi:hypothetical protein BYT27DRAFT_7198453 [Phlegmacium glaucopus]|nr:hypothetical protein BYT27DRAFT_7198453 [Phlegmacium glaucopus]
MVSQAFEGEFVAYLHVASLSVLLWDILNNVRDECRLVFRHRMGPPIVVYFLSRFSVLGFALVSTIFMTTPSIACTAFKATFVAFFITAMVSTLFLSYLRVCAVWHWNPFVVAVSGISWLSVVATGFAVINSIQGIEVENYCLEIIVGPLIVAPIITSFLNHVVVFFAITLGVCKNTLGRGLTIRDCIRLMFGRGLSTFSKALLHESQVCYIIVMVIAAIAITWFYVWLAIEPTTAFRIAIAPLYVVLVNIMICRVFRNTKLGLYNKIPHRSHDSKSQSHTAPNSNSTTSWNSRYESADAHSIAATPIQISVSQVVECKSDYPPLMTQGSERSVVLDFGMV